MTIHPKAQAPEALRAHFEALASDPSFKLSRSRRGTYVNPAVARDWKWFQLGASRAQQPAPAAGAVAGQIELSEVARVIKDGDGVWRPCTGCHELNEGHDTGAYSKVFGCALGNGCSECGGLGAIWDATDYEAMAEAMMEAEAPTPATQADIQPAQCSYSIDADPQGIRAMVADAITGALAFGAQGSNPPPEGHWLAPFWNAARADRSQADNQPASPTDYPTLPEPSATGLGDEYEAFDCTGRAMGKAYETILYFKADQMRAYVDADRAARKQGGV